MNSKTFVLLSICSLLISQIGLVTARLGPQLMPLPAMAQAEPVVQNQPVAQAVRGVEGREAGEVQFLKPTLTLVADKNSRVDLDAPPLDAKIPLEVEIVKKPSSIEDARLPVEVINQETTVRPVKIESPKVKTAILDDGKTLKPIYLKGGAVSINANLFSTIVIVAASSLMINVARTVVC